MVVREDSEVHDLFTEWLKGEAKPFGVANTAKGGNPLTLERGERFRVHRFIDQINRCLASLDPGNRLGVDPSFSFHTNPLAIGRGNQVRPREYDRTGPSQ